MVSDEHLSLVTLFSGRPQTEIESDSVILGDISAQARATDTPMTSEFFKVIHKNPSALRGQTSDVKSQWKPNEIVVARQSFCNAELPSFDIFLYTDLASWEQDLQLLAPGDNLLCL